VLRTGLILVFFFVLSITISTVYAEETAITITGEPNPMYGKVHHYIIQVEGKLYNNGISQVGIFVKDDPSKSGQQIQAVLHEGANRFGLNLLDYGDSILPYEVDKTYVMEIINLNNVGTFEFTPRYPDDPRKPTLEYEYDEIERSQPSQEELKQREIECEKEVDEDNSLTLAEKIIQKKNCKTYGNRYGEVSDCPSFLLWLQPAEGQGTFVSNIIDLGTIMHIKGAGACNTDVDLSFQKKGFPEKMRWSVHAPSSGFFGDQLLFSKLDDIGEYILTAKNVKTREEISLNFAVRQLENPKLDPIQSSESQSLQKIQELEERIAQLEEQIKQKDAVLMEQLKVIMELANKIRDTVFEKIIPSLLPI